MSPGFKDYLEEKRLAFKPFFSISLIQKWPTLLLIFLLLSLPFVFRFLQLHDEEDKLKRKQAEIDMEIVKEKERTDRLKKELQYSEDPRFLEVLMMERLGVVPRGSKVLSKE